MARYTTTITADKARVPVLLSNGNPGAVERSRRRPASRRPGPIRIPKPCYLFALVAGDLVAVKRQLHHPLRPARRARHLGAPRRRGSLRPRHALAEDRDEVGRGRVRPRIRPRRVQHRRRVRLQHGRDGEQGPQRLQHEIRAGAARKPRPTAITRASNRSSRTSISTTGPATASPAATGSSFR